MRDALGDKVAVVIDEKDQRELDDKEAEEDDATALSSIVEHVNVTRRVSTRAFDDHHAGSLATARLISNIGSPSDHRQLSRRGIEGISCVTSHRRSLG